MTIITQLKLFSNKMNNKYVKIITGDNMLKKIRFKDTCIYAILITLAYILLQGTCYGIAYNIVGREDIAYVLGYTINIAIIFFIYRKNLIKDFFSLKNDIKDKVKHLIIAYIIFTALLYTTNFILFYLTDGLANNEEIIRTSLFASPILMSIALCILGPITEELTFRYPFHFTKTNRLVSFLIYSLIFASMHIITSTSLIELLYLIPYLFLSMSIGYSFYKTDNIYTSMFFHILNNTITIALVLLIGG